MPHPISRYGRTAQFRTSLFAACALPALLVSGAALAQFGSAGKAPARSFFGGGTPTATGGPLQLPGSILPFVERAIAARNTSDFAQELAALQEGLASVGPEARDAFWLHQELRQYYADRGLVAQVLRTAEQQLKTAATPAQELQVLASLVTVHSSMRNAPAAKQALDRAMQTLERLRFVPNWGRFGSWWQALASWANGNYHASAGHIAESEAAYQACLASMQNFLGPNPDAAARGAFLIADCTGSLIVAQIQQGKLADAGALASQQRGFVESVASGQQRPQILARLAPPFARVAVEQGRNDEARKILDTALAQQLKSNAGEGSLRVANLRLQLALIDMLENKWDRALQWHETRRKGLESAAGERGNIGVASPEYGYTLIRNGRGAQAVGMLAQVADARERLFDESSLYRWEGRAFYGVALAAAGKRPEALKELSAAVPKMLELSNGERSSADAGVLRATRLNWILDGYINLLSDYARSGERAGNLDPANEAFRLADLARGSTVQRALTASASRAGISDPALAELARREQDLQREMSSLSDAIGNLLSRGRIAEQDKIVADMRAGLAKLRGEHAQAQRDLQRRFPEYANLIEPRPIGVAEVQKLLRPGEAMISIYTGSDRTLVWAVPAQGAVAFAVSPLNAEQIGEMVAKLRRTLDPADAAIERMPPYDFETAHGLYKALLAPVEAGWKSAKELIIVPHGRLGQIPFSVLTTQPWKSGGGGLPFADMANAPWLIRQAAISQLPAAIALTALRGRPAAGRAERAFLGFGDPVFSALASAPGTSAAAPTRGLGRRNLVINTTEEKKNDIAAAVDFNLLAQLPDTSAEILEVAKILGADAARDIFLQKRASEHNVKTGELSAYRVLMFATHGLVPGEMPGLYQPALALSNPAVSGDGEDGMLTMEEILALKLRADWVVLSACNTASASGNGSEAVSGLGRAFFYAGAKALLVTSWPVETVSARLLTTDAFRRQSQTPGLSRSRAMQESSLDLMKKSSGSFSYAHPLFWAPYVVVGDGG